MIQLISPMAEEINEPSLNQLVELVLHEGSMYWNSGCGAAELIFYSEGERTSLELIFERQAGFYILFKDEDGKRFMAKSQGNPSQVFTPYVGGEPMPIPGVFFVPRQLAAIAVEYFHQTGKPTPQITWVDSSDSDWSAIKS